MPSSCIACAYGCRHIDIDAVVSGLQQRARLGNAMTPKMFQHNLKALCLKNPQRIVLPEVRLRIDSRYHGTLSVRVYVSQG
jgi:hypothetical protein